jgi:hypothetical protein
MEPSRPLPNTENAGVINRLRHFACLHRDDRERLEEIHAWHKANRPQKEPEEYQAIAQLPYPILGEYRVLRQMYDQLAFWADTDARYFTFVNEANYSFCTAPEILISKLNAPNSLVRLQQLQAAGEMPREDDCQVFGKWCVMTRQPAMIEALQEFPLQKKGHLFRFRGTWCFRSGRLQPAEFDQMRALILGHQGQFVLPYCDETDLALTPRQITEHELKQMQAAKDAWL